MSAAASFRDHSMSLCMSMGFCRTPMSCGYYDDCEKPGEAVAFVDKGLRAIGQPSTYEQWAVAQVSQSSADIKPESPPGVHTLESSPDQKSAGPTPARVGSYQQPPSAPAAGASISGGAE